MSLTLRTSLRHFVGVTGSKAKSQRRLKVLGPVAGCPAEILETRQLLTSDAEIWSGAFGVGRRKFNVLADGVLKLNDLDVYAEAGAKRALVKSFETVSDGVQNLRFLHVVQNPMISGIQLTRVTGTGVGGTSSACSAGAV